MVEKNFTLKIHYRNFGQFPTPNFFFKLPMRRLLFVLMMSNVSLLFSQGNAFTFYSANEGLAQSTVMDIYKDPDGLLWAGTGEGLSLWNGHTFRNVKHRYNDPLGLSNNVVRQILPDPLRHCVWVGTESGVDCFNEDATKIIDKIELPEWEANTYLPLFATETHIWIFITGKGIYKVDLKTHTYTEIRKSKVYYFWKIFPGTDLLYYQDELQQLVKIHLLNGKAETVKLPLEEAGFNLTDMIPCPGGFLWLSSHGLWRSDTKAEHFTPIENFTSLIDVRKEYFTCISKDSSGRFWISVKGKGVYTTDLSLTYLRPQHWNADGENISKRMKNVRKIYCDAYNVLWMATNDEGLIRYNGNRLFFGSCLTELPVLDTTNWFIRAFYAEGNTTWVGTFENGLKKINYSTGKIDAYYSPLFTTIYCITQSSPGALYIGTDNGLYEFTDGKFTSIITTSEDGSPYVFLNFLRLRDGRLVFATNQRMMVKDERTGKIIPFDGSRGIYSGITERADGTIVCASKYYGLCVFDKNLHEVKMQHYTAMGIPKATTVTAFVPDENNGLWAASNLGLLHLDATLRITEVFTDKNGLPSNMIYSILRLPSGEMLITTGNGISIMNTHEKSFRNFNSKDGLRSNESNTRTLLFAPDQYVYIGGTNGFTRKKYPFDEPASLILKCFVENFSVNNTVRDTSFPLNDLNYFQNTLSFDLRYSDFAFSESGGWMYRVDGLDTHLTAIPSSVPFRFTSLPPGAYTVHVFAPGYAGTELYRVPFVILPPWWQTTWFKFMLAIGILIFSGALLYLLIHLRYRKKLQKLQALRMVENIRTRISGDIHDDLGAGLTKIALTSDLVAMELKEDLQASKKIGHVAKVARDLSESLKEVVWSVKPEHDNLESVIRYFKSFCGEFFEDTDIKCTFHTNTYTENISVSPEYRRNLFLIFKEALNNMLKHSDAKNATIEISITNTMLAISITDDGKGIDEAVQKINSSGLVNMKRRAALLGMRMEIKKHHPRGTKISLEGEVGEILLSG